MKRDEGHSRGGTSNGGRRMSPTPPMLVNEIARLFHAEMRAHDTGGVMAQESARLIMHALSHGADGCSQLELVRLTHLKPPTVSVTVKRMEEAGLLRREQNLMDQRAVKVFLTERGHAHTEEVHLRLRRLDDLLMQGFSEEERELLSSYLLRMRENILSEKQRNDT